MIEWTEERISTLRRLRLRENRTSVEIAAMFGCSKSAIIGKLRRLGLSEPRVKNGPPKKRLPPRTRGGLDPFRRCQWLWRKWEPADGPNPPICGEQALLGHSWCPVHHHKVFIPRNKIPCHPNQHLK